MRFELDRGEFHFQKRSHNGLLGPHGFRMFSGRISLAGLYSIAQPEMNR